MKQAAFKHDLFSEIDDLRLQRDQARELNMLLTALSVLLGGCVIYSILVGW